MLECSSELTLLSVHSCHGKSCGNTGYHTNYFAYVKIRSCGCHSDICCDGAHSSNTVNWLGAAVKCKDRLACVETPDISVVAMTMDVVACVLLTSVAAVVELV